MSTPLLDVHIRKRVPGFELDYALRTDDRCVGVFGPSGAGKTTVVECVAGWRRPDAGHVRVAGRTLYDSARGVDLPLAARGIGYVPQDVLLFPHWDVRRNVLAGATRGDGTARGDHPERVLAFLELDGLADRPVTALSGGERHRVALARALCSRPDLLLLDEPLSSLDVHLKRRVLGDLLRVGEEFGVPTLLISHDATEVQVLCDRAQWLLAGRVAAEGPPGAVLDEALSAAGATDFENVLRGRVVEGGERLARVALGDGAELLVPGGELEVGERVLLGVGADDVLVALAPPEGLSARNVLRARVETVHLGPRGVTVRARVAPEASLQVNLTESSVAELGIAAGREVHLVLKSRSVHVLTRVRD